MANIILERIGDDWIGVHIDTLVTDEIVNAVTNVEGVEMMITRMKYEFNLIVGQAFDRETVELNIQAELIKILP